MISSLLYLRDRLSFFHVSPFIFGFRTNIWARTHIFSSSTESKPLSLWHRTRSKYPFFSKQTSSAKPHKRQIHTTTPPPPPTISHMSSSHTATLESFQFKLLRLADKLDSLGFPRPASSKKNGDVVGPIFVDGGFEFAQSAPTEKKLLKADQTRQFFAQMLLSLTFLECNCLRLFESDSAASNQKDNNHTRQRLLVVPNVSQFVGHALSPYFDRLACSSSSSSCALSSALPVGRVLASVSNSLKIMMNSADGGVKTPSQSGIETLSLDDAVTILTAMTIIVDVAAAVRVVHGSEEGNEAVVQSSSSSSLPAATIAERKALIATPTTASAKKKNTDAQKSLSSKSLSAKATSDDEGNTSKQLEIIMLNLIAVFGLSPPPKDNTTTTNNNNTATASSGSDDYLRTLSRMAARCVFLGQRIVLSPKGFTMEDARASIAHVPLFDAESSKKAKEQQQQQQEAKKQKDTASEQQQQGTLELYTQSLRLLLTLESELLQRFATMVVDEAQAYTAQCAFDPSGHRVGV